jgi:hypothetical protein
MTDCNNNNNNKSISTTAIVSARRLSKVNFDKLLMAHQDSPLLEGARETVEKLVDESIRKLKKVGD